MTEHPAGNGSLELTFDKLDLEPELLEGIAEAGFVRCTPIQAQALPLALAGADVAGQAQTGTGKTAAFLLAMFNRLLKADKAGGGRSIQPPPRTRPRAVILAPTRELALQIHSDALVLGKHTGYRIGVVFGGTGYVEQREMVLEGLDVLVGTPGRLIDYFKQKLFDLEAIEVVVLDEADRMFDLGFIKDIRFVLRRLPPPARRLNMLFSATLSYRVTELAYEHMNDPRLINVAPEQMTVDEVTQVLYHVSKEEKIPLLLGLMKRIDPTRTIVFVNTKGGAERVSRFLEGNGFQVGLLSGDVPQKKRMRLLERFQAGDLAILVATDVAARGLHIADVSHVINFDLPQDAEDYVHRIGRTARAGARGDAVSFGCEEYVFSLESIEDFIRQRIPVVMVTDDLLVKPKRPAPRPPSTERVRPGRSARGRDGRDGAGRGKRRPRGHAGRGAAAGGPSPPPEG